MDGVLQQEDMEAVLHDATESSEALEKLLTQASRMGTPGPELVEKIIATNKRCDELMHLYITAYRKYHG